MENNSILGAFADAISRRRFLSLLSASAALAAGTTSCSTVDRGHLVPYTKQSQECIPGVATYYASTFQEGFVTQGVLVKTREGRPLHIEGNPDCPISPGKSNLRALADLFGLYDPDRLRGPIVDGKTSTWENAEAEIGNALRAARNGLKPVLFLTDAVVSPTRKALIEDLKNVLPSLIHATWDPLAPLQQLSAARAVYGECILPRLRFDRASVILSFQADFLGADENAAGCISHFAAQRIPAMPSDTMCRLWVVEGAMTLTGSNADHRIPVRPSQIARFAFTLAHVLNESLGVPLPIDIPTEDLSSFSLDALEKELRIERSLPLALAEDLRRAGKSSLVLAGNSLPLDAHIACALLNAMLGAEGYAVDTSFCLPASEPLSFAAFHNLLAQAAQGNFSAAIFWGTNPAYTFPNSAAWKNAVAKIPTTIRIGLYEDETALDCQWRLPENHWLEAWGDFESASDFITMRQPAVAPMHNSRQGEDILLSFLRFLSATFPKTYLEYLRSRWRRDVSPPSSPVPFESFWNAALHDGVLKRNAVSCPSRSFNGAAVRDAINSASLAASASSSHQLELLLLPSSAIYDGRYANNGWLNELPDPVTKSTWSNPLLISIADAQNLDLKDGDMVALAANLKTIELPVLVQPGQALGVASLCLGYGRRTGSVASGIGVDAYPLLQIPSSSPFLLGAARITPLQRARRIPKTQEHYLVEGRDLARSWSVSQYARNLEQHDEIHSADQTASLINAPSFKGQKWGMTIDLSACVGCSACVIACQSENNVPVVGPERVLRAREMHWLRIDRYYSGDLKNPSVIHQPIPCQHCDHAPCEIVCPANATTHSPDGLNQMTYNRCVGTRYCSNNCPFKVRRFNYFDYTSFKKPPENFVFNPDVTVRPRGVMEKCSFCIQRIQDARQRAKIEGRPIQDGEIKPACAVACPADAIVFGDLNDSQSKVSKMSKMNRSYRMLEELGIKPAVTYLADISNPVSGEGKG